MSKKLQQYMTRIDCYLRSVPRQERVDIIEEIKMEIYELQTNENLNDEEIIERIGEPKKLASAYISNLILKSDKNKNNPMLMIAFWVVTGFSGVVILPVTVSLWWTCYLCAIIVPVAGLSRWIFSIFKYEISFIKFQIGNYTIPPLVAFLISILIGGGFVLAGKLFQFLSVRYITLIRNKMTSNKIYRIM